MSSALYALGRWAFRARRAMLLIWVAVLAVLFTGAALLSEGTENSYSIPGTESQEALDALARTFPQVSGSSAQLIAVAPEGGSVTDADFESAVEASATAIAAVPQVTSATSPYSSATSEAANIASDDSAVIVPIQLSVTTSEVLPSTADALQSAGRSLEAALPDGSEVAVGGQLFSQTSTGISVTELLGIAIAYVVLLITFGSLIAAGLPLVTALLGVAASLSIVLAGTGFMTITSTTPLLALMLGLAVGIDYALFIVSRHQDQLKHGLDPEESAARAVATSGSAVVFAATTVIIALLGLTVAGIPFLTTMGVAAALAVAVAVLISLTLTPALLGFARWRVVAKRFRPVGADAAAPIEIVEHADASTATRDDDAAVASSPFGLEPHATGGPGGPGEPDDADRAEETAEEAARSIDDDDGEHPPARRGFFWGWVRTVTRWPAVTIVVIVGLLGLATLPAAHLRLALPDAGSLEEDAPGRIAYDLIAEHFGPGYNGPLIVTGTIIESTDPVALMDDLAASVAAVDGVAAVPLATPNETGDTGIVQVIPEGSPDSEATKALVAELRAMHDDWQEQYGVDLSVTGYTAAGIDISARLADALLPFGLLVIGLSLVLLAMVFRSIVVPVTAALGYALSVGAAFGLTSAVFVDGVLAGPLNVADVGTVISFMPIILMGVLFGLAMDYEVFLVSRMREDYVHQGDAESAVDTGFLSSARVVTAAAIIMFAVFAAFVPEGDASIQPIAFGLAVGVAIDAFVVRMSLIPAVLVLFGARAWWMPRSLDRMLPHFDIEGEGLAEEFALADWPAPGARFAIAAEGVRAAVPGLDDERDASPHLDAMVPPGAHLVLLGGTDGERTRLLLALGGRARVAAGRLKSVGFVVPPRASAVRARSALVRFTDSATALDRVRGALDARPELLLLDGIEEVGDPGVVGGIRSLLAEAGGGAAAGAIRRRPALTIVVAARDVDAAVRMLPEDAPSQRAHLAEPAAAFPADTAATLTTAG
ncbi:MMPL family transporter [Agromyces sp. NPDC057679]|uniref:MMPL family transporter n=1 Tax=Agromyces sp. NPDC057679 TaxID=3346207 RepID=UPI003673540A